MRYNYFYYGVAIPKKQFDSNVPNGWESEIDELGVYTYGGYEAVIITHED